VGGVARAAGAVPERQSNDPAQFKDTSTQVVVDPPAYASGKLVYPYDKAK